MSRSYVCETEREERGGRDLAKSTLLVRPSLCLLTISCVYLGLQARGLVGGLARTQERGVGWRGCVTRTPLARTSTAQCTPRDVRRCRERREAVNPNHTRFPVFTFLRTMRTSCNTVHPCDAVHVFAFFRTGTCHRIASRRSLLPRVPPCRTGRSMSADR